MAKLTIKCVKSNYGRWDKPGRWYVLQPMQSESGGGFLCGIKNDELSDARSVYVMERDAFQATWIGLVKPVRAF